MRYRRSTHHHHHHQNFIESSSQQQQIEKMTDDFKCTICLENFETGLKHNKDKGGCGQPVCRQCYSRLTLMEGSTRCPSCRGDFRPGNAIGVIKQKPKPYKPPKPKCRRCGGNHKDENSLKCPNKWMTWKQYWRPANINGGNKPKPTFCQQCMQEGKVYHHIDQLIEMNPRQKKKQSIWEQILRNSPATFVCNGHRMDSAILFDVSSSEDEASADEVIDSGSGWTTENEEAPAATTGGGSKDYIDKIFMMMRQEIDNHKENTNRIIRLIQKCETIAQLNSLKDLPLFKID